MKFGTLDRYMTGVAVPLSALRSEDGCGIGEFRDLVDLGRWCQKTGLDLIQILPVNDTGGQLSPYSARSAFALHPIYLHLPAIAGAEPLLETIAAESERLNREAQIDFRGTYDFKISILRRIFEQRQRELESDARVAAFKMRDGWVRPYAAYRALKRRFDGRPWCEWPEFSSVDPDTVDRIWELESDECHFQVFVQYEADRQFREAAAQLDGLGIKLKGDIPILIDDDSADVWYHRRYFDRTMRAGAPPDMFSREGQNWGFPTYNWERLELDDYRWWRERLAHADRYYHAYRVDHVLGFFRIWQTPERDRSAILGWFHPAVPLSESDLHRREIDGAVLRELSEALVPAELVASLDASQRDHLLEEAGDGWRFRSEVGERAIEDGVSAGSLRDQLLWAYRERLFVRGSRPGEFHPCWYWRDSPRGAVLDEETRAAIEELVDERAAKNEQLWGQTGRRRLSFMVEATEMLVCAEDLGVVPDCVPGVLDELAILGLRVDRWTHEPGEPSRFLPMGEYPRLSVATTSTHDTETLRGFWESGAFDRQAYYREVLSADGLAPSYLTTEVAALCISRCLEASSILCILPLQDWFSLHYDLRSQTPEDERVNVPGAPEPRNWRWRTRETLSYYLGYERFNRYVASLVERRQRRPLA